MGTQFMTGVAGQQRVSDAFIRNLVIGFPDVNEQRAIVAFLDRETARIDAMIEKKERLIALLEEKRTALISHAVTKGLDPTAPTKDSGIPWLGEIPAHWEVKRLKHIVKERLQYGANEAAMHDNRAWIRFVRITDIDENGNLRDDTFRSLHPEIAEPYLLQRGDILFARSGATVGKTFQYSEAWGPSCFAGYLILCRPDPRKVMPKFLYMVTKSGAYQEWKNSIFIQATIENISAEKYNNLYSDSIHLTHEPGRGVGF